MLSHQSLFMIFFLIGILGVLLLDLGVLTKSAHKVEFKEAMTWTLIWISLGLGFFVFLRFQGDFIFGFESIEDFRNYYAEYGHKDPGFVSLQEWRSDFLRIISLEYLTGYVIEYSLSVDNVFVILMIFLAFGVKEEHYKIILFWGILGAVVLRLIFIFAGAALIHEFEWVLYLFGAFLVGTGVVMFIKRKQSERIDPAHHPVVRFASKHFAVSPQNDGSKFFTRIEKNGKWKRAITPLFLVLMVVEFSDVIFAFDSIPAIFGITRNPHIVFFSNIFAIIGLRSLFFLVSGLVHKIAYLKIGLAFLLVFIGMKMLLHNPYFHIEIPVTVSLMVIVGILLLSVLASVLFPPKRN